MPSAAPPSLVIDQILAQLRTGPLREVLFVADQRVDNLQLLNAVLRLTAALRDQGVGMGSVVAVCCSRSADLVAVLLALWCRGAVYLPLDPGWPLQRLGAVLDCAAPDLLLYQPEHEALATRLPVPTLRIDAICFSAASAPVEIPASALGADTPAYILFTSGSSGTPKGVLVSHSNLATLFQGCLQMLDLQRGWRYLCCSALNFDIVFFELLAPLLSGGCIVLARDEECRDPTALVQLVESRSVDVVQGTPSLWRLLLLEGLGNQRPLPLALCTGEALPRTLAVRVLACSERAWNLYGPTETTIWASAQRLDAAVLAQPGADSVSIGQPLPGYRLSLEAENSEGRGELLISGPGVALGYVSGAGTAQARFSEDAQGERCFHSGDCCSRDAAGRYHFHHRLDTQLKINGYRIEAGEVEAALERLPEVVQACCLARPLADGSSVLVAFVVCRAGMPNRNRAGWNRQLEDRLPSWMLPHRYYVVRELPLTAGGKRDRQALLALATPQAAGSTEVEPGTEAQVRRIFCDLLECESIASCESFFDAGGSSMLAATLLLLLNHHFNSRLHLAELLATPPTVRSVCELLERSAQA